MAALKGANLTLRFVLEVCAIFAMGYWGWHAHSGLSRWLMVIAAPAAWIALWGLFGSPKARVDLSAPAHLGFEIVMAGVAAVALYVAGRPELAVGFAVVCVVNRLLGWVWGQNRESTLGMGP